MERVQLWRPMADKVEVKVVTASASLVDGLLAKNTHNRTVKPGVVAWLSNQIRAGNWRLNNQGVAVSKHGVLLDGQHRLLAIRESGYPPVKFVLVTGLEPDAVATIDVGVRRNHSDTLKLLLNQEISTRVVAGLSVLANFHWNGDAWTRLPQSARCSSIDLVPYLEAYEPAIVQIGNWASWHDLRAEVRAAFIVLCRAFPDRAEGFIRQVTTGELIDRSMPAYWLREVCLRPQVRPFANDLNCAVRCINDFINKRPMRMWKSSMAEDWCPEIKERMPHVDTR